MKNGQAAGRPAALFVAYLEDLPLHHRLDAARANRGESSPTEADNALRTALRSFVSAAAVFETRTSVLAAL